MKILLESTQVNAIMRKIEYSLRKEGVGVDGQLLVSDLLNASDFADDIDKIESGDDYMETELFQMWQNYANAIEKTYPNSALDFDVFVYHIQKPNVYIFGYDGSYVVGFYDGGFFKPSHYCPRPDPIRHGVLCLKKLIRYDNIVFAVTPQLKIMLSKMGAYSHDNLIFPYIFR